MTTIVVPRPSPQPPFGRFCSRKKRKENLGLRDGQNLRGGAGAAGGGGVLGGSGGGGVAVAVVWAAAVAALAAAAAGGRRALVVARAGGRSRWWPPCAGARRAWRGKSAVTESTASRVSRHASSSTPVGWGTSQRRGADAFRPPTLSVPTSGAPPAASGHAP